MMSIWRMGSNILWSTINYPLLPRSQCAIVVVCVCYYQHISKSQVKESDLNLTEEKLLVLWDKKLINLKILLL